VIQQRLDRRRDQGKREEEQRHKAEIQAVKDKFTQKLQLEKERIQLENSRLLEESGDIDYQIRLFKADLQDNQYEQKRVELEREIQERLKVYEGEIQKKLDKERERVRGDLEGKLDRERDKEMRKYKLETSKLTDRKDDLLKTHQTRLRDHKRTQDKVV